MTDSVRVSGHGRCSRYNAAFYIVERRKQEEFDQCFSKCMHISDVCTFFQAGLK